MSRSTASTATPPPHSSKNLTALTEDDKLVLVSSHIDEVIDGCTRVLSIEDGQLTETLEDNP